MALTAEEKQDIIAKYATHEGDTGSPEVQVALLTKRIADLPEHLKEHNRLGLFAAAVSEVGRGPASRTMAGITMRHWWNHAASGRADRLPQRADCARHNHGLAAHEPRA